MPTSLLNVDPESWKYSNINAALKKLDIAPAAAAWDMTGTYAFVQPDTAPDTLHLVIPRNKQVSLPLDMALNGQDGQELRTNIIIDVESGADVTLLERQRGEGSYWKHITLTINVAANAFCRHYRLCEEDPFAVVTEFTNVTLARDARYHMVSINGCAGFGRAEFHVDINDTGAEADLSGVALIRGKQHADTTVVINHKAAHGRSSQFFKHILEDQARGVFQGKIHVFKDAQKTDGYQLSNNLLLSPLAEMDIKPELEIYADDVKCSHGTTTGQLDETPLFYLMSRGIDKDSARRLLLEAFLMEVVQKIGDDNMRARFEDRVKLWLA